MNRVIEEDIKIINNTFDDIMDAMKHSTVLITGACGMITSYLACLLISKADMLDIRLYLQCRNLEKAQKIYDEYKNNPRVSFVDMPLNHMSDDDTYYDYIIHGASLTGTEHFMKDPVGVIEPNVIGTWNLLEHSRKKGVKKFIFLSSSQIYGQVSPAKDLTESDYGTADPLGLKACYIEGKKMGEQLCSAYSRQYGINTGIVRICHTYGPTCDIEHDTKPIPRFVRTILAGEDVTLYKDPDSLIQYTYVADIVTAILFVINKGEAGEAYNACGRDIVTMDQAVLYMLNADSNIKSRLIEKAIDENYLFSKGKGMNFSKLDNKKLTDIGWKQLFSMEEGFTRMIMSFLI